MDNQIISMPKFLTVEDISSNSRLTCPIQNCYCQTTCQVLGQCSCLTLCQVSCQSCQSMCEGCQTTCEMYCQGCMDGCMANCQSTCEKISQMSIPKVTINVANITTSSFNVYVKVDGIYSSLSIKLYKGAELIRTDTSSPVSYSSLEYSTNYTVVATATNTIGSDTSSESVRTRQGKFFWRGGSNADGTFAKGDLTTRLKASEWNEFIKAIGNRYNEQYGVFPALDMVASKDTITATNYNKVIRVLRTISGVGSIPSDVGIGDDIEAEKHINSIAVAFNSTIN